MYILSSKHLTLKSIGGIILSFLFATPALAELSPAEINSIARQTTVIIAPALNQELSEAFRENRKNPLKENEGIWNPGSGVIVARKENIEQQKTSFTSKELGYYDYKYVYYVLTVTHNFRQKYLKTDFPYYGIMTIDGKVHEVNNLNDGRDCPPLPNVTIRKLIRFGCDYVDENQPIRKQKIDGYDLAIVSFKSDQEYPVASLGDSSAIKVNDKVYLSGWPDPEKERDPDNPKKCRGRVERRQRRLAWGLVQGKIDDPSKSRNGYSVFYTDVTHYGMSGGPVFDTNGRLVGVHGNGSKEIKEILDKYCSLSAARVNIQLEYPNNNLGTQTANLDIESLYNKFSSAQSLQLFLDLTKKADINNYFPFNQQSPSPEVIQAGITSVPDEVGKGDAGIFDDPEDVIENIYEDFTLHFVESAIRSRPSGTCWSLLIGEDFCNASR